MSEIALRWSGGLLVLGAALLGAAIVIVSLKPVVNQVFTPGVSLLFLISSMLILLASSLIWIGFALWMGNLGRAVAHVIPAL